MITVEDIFLEKRKKWNLKLIAGEEGIKNEIKTPDVERPGLILTGFTKYFKEDRIQVMGKMEYAYLRSIGKRKSESALRYLLRHKFPALFLTHTTRIREQFKTVGAESNIPIISTPISATEFIRELSGYLSLRLAPAQIVHGTLVDVYGVGLLITGRSGIGKSECALDLVERGHVFVADDLVKLVHFPRGVLTGESMADKDLMKHFIEIRGVGLLDVYSLFGIKAIRDTKRVEVHIELIDWSETLDYERTGLEEKYSEFLGVKIPHLKLPLNPGKNIAIIIEAIAMNYHLKLQGYPPAKVFEKNLLKEIKKKG